MTDADMATEVARLRRENHELRQELRVAQEAATISAHKVIEQFGKTEEALQRLRTTSARLQAVLDAASEIAIIACDRDGTIRLFSRGAERLLGYRARAMVGRRSILDLHRDTEVAEAARNLVGDDPPRRDRMRVFQWLVEQGLTGVREWTYVRSDGTTLPVNLSVTPLSAEDENGAGFLSVAMDISWRKALEAKLEHQANHDPLTGLMNRRAFEEVLEREASRQDRYRTSFSLLMFDIDHFKSINDTYGHDVGDDILQAMSRLVGDRLRGPDMVARWGGEEFIVLLPETRRDGAGELAEDLRATVADQDFPGPGQVTISIGVGEHDPGEPVHTLIKRIDDALYEGKKSGRNCVIEA